MVINWNTPDDSKPPDPPRVRAAQYVRMSTEHQQYSTDNQAAAIQRFADAHGYEIVRTYQDDGKSGLNLSGRSGLKLLIADVDARRTDFSALLGLRLIHSQKATAVASATPERKLAASLS